MQSSQPIRHLYVHVPFCPRICPYCSFYVEKAERGNITKLVDALIVEWQERHAFLSFSLQTVYLGGGTPSALPTVELRRLIHSLSLGNSINEFTIEMNPTTVSFEKAEQLRTLGINRVSLGAQSFSLHDLQTLGRQHSPERIVHSFQILRKAGFENVNLDLIFGTPGQTTDSWLETLYTAIQLKPNHISTYCLTYEEDTPFFNKLKKGEWQLDPKRDTTLYLTTIETLERNGYLQYEVSNFSKPGFESQHNLAYWKGCDFLGIGPSAVSTIGSQRWKNVPDLAQYIQATASRNWPVTDLEALTKDIRKRERFMFGLRTREGVAEEGFESELQELQQAGYAIQNGSSWRLTREGLLRADSIAQLFL